MFAEAGNVLKTAQHKGLLDISGDADSKPFAIRILDSSTLSASALSGVPVAHPCFLSVSARPCSRDEHTAEDGATRGRRGVLLGRLRRGRRECCALR